MNEAFFGAELYVETNASKCWNLYGLHEETKYNLMFFLKIYFFQLKALSLVFGFGTCSHIKEK